MDKSARSSPVQKLMTEPEVAAMLGVSRRWVQKARAAGTGPRYLKLSGIERGGTVRYRRDDVDAWLKSKEAASTSEVKAPSRP